MPGHKTKDLKGERGFKEFVGEQKAKGSRLWHYDDDEVFNFSEDEKIAEYLGDDGSSRRQRTAFEDKSRRNRPQLQRSLGHGRDGTNRRMPTQVSFRLDSVIKKKLDLVCLHTRQTTGEVLRSAILDAFEDLENQRKALIEEKARIEQMLQERGEYTEHKVKKALSEKAPWKRAEQSRLARGMPPRTPTVKQRMNQPDHLYTRKTPLSPEMEEKRRKNMEEVNAKKEKNNSRVRRWRAKRALKKQQEALGISTRDENK